MVFRVYINFVRFYDHRMGNYFFFLARDLYIDIDSMSMFIRPKKMRYSSYIFALGLRYFCVTYHVLKHSTKFNIKTRSVPSLILLFINYCIICRARVSANDLLVRSSAELY